MSRTDAGSRTDADLAGRKLSEQHNARSSVAGSVYEPTFDAVLALAKEGCRSAFEEFFVALNRPLHAFCLARGSTDGEGTVNEVFLKVFKNVRHFNGTEDQFRSWVFTIARNQLIDDGRRAQRRPVESGIGGHDDWVGGNVEAEAIDQLGNEWLHDQLSILTSDQRDVLLLRIVSDLTVEATAEVMGKEPGAIKALQRRALRALHRHMTNGPAPL